MSQNCQCLMILLPCVVVTWSAFFFMFYAFSKYTSIWTLCGCLFNRRFVKPEPTSCTIICLLRSSSNIFLVSFLFFTLLCSTTQEAQMLQVSYRKEVETLRQSLLVQGQKLEAAQQRVTELETHLSKKEHLIAEQKKFLEDVKCQAKWVF